MGEVIIGTCGYGYYKPKKGWKDRYKSKLQAFSDHYKCVELNRTFYKLPMKKTAEKWKNNVFDNFEFTLKAWQALTHPTSSPTWRNKKDKLTDSQKKNFGYLRPNEYVINAWKETKDIAGALDVDICVIQTPRSFECNSENEKNMRELFTNIKHDDITLAWEPRGNWKENKDKIKSICDDLDLIHIVDIMRRKPLSDQDKVYIRLHGLNEDEYDYNYDYSNEELKDLSDKLMNLTDSHEKVYCMFNNYEMYNNADTLRNILNQNKE